MRISDYDPANEEGERWTAEVFTGKEHNGVEYPDSAQLPGTYETEGQALDAAKKWAADRGLMTTWSSLTLRQPAASRGGEQHG